MSASAYDIIAYIQREIARSGIDLARRDGDPTGPEDEGIEEGVNIDEADVTGAQLHQASAPSMPLEWLRKGVQRV